MIFFYALIIILSASLYAFYPSFNLAVFGDYWVTVRRYEMIVGELSPGIWNHFTYLHTSYGSQDIITGLLTNIFGYNSFYFYLTAYLLRIIAAFSFYPVTRYLTKNKLPAFSAVLFFSITTIGLETTNWVFNMSSYLMVFFFNLFLYFLIKSREPIHTKLFSLACLFFYLTLVSSPIRTTGLFPFVIFIEFFWLIKKFTTATFKKVLLRSVLISLIFIFLLTQTTTFIPIGSDTQTIHPVAPNFLSMTLESLTNMQTESLLYPIVILGGAFIPNLTGNQEIFHLLIGLMIVLIWLYILFINRGSKLSDIVAVSLSWFFLSFLIVLFWYPNTLFPTIHRYLISSAIGITFFLSSLIAIEAKKYTRVIIFSGILVIFLIQIQTTHQYFAKLQVVRNQQLSNKVWSQMPNFPEVGHTEKPLVFYFNGDNTDMVFNIINFGFPQRIELIYKVPKEQTLVTALNFEELISAVKDGKSLTKHILPEEPVPVENIYTFYLKEDGALVNTTNITREELSKLLKTNN